MLWQHPDGDSLSGVRREGLGPLIPALQPTRVTQIPAVPSRISSIPAVPSRVTQIPAKPCSPPGKTWDIFGAPHAVSKPEDPHHQHTPTPNPPAPHAVDKP